MTRTPGAKNRIPGELEAEAKHLMEKPHSNEGSKR